MGLLMERYKKTLMYLWAMFKDECLPDIDNKGMLQYLGCPCLKNPQRDSKGLDIT